MNEMKTLPLAFTYVGVFLGAGFVSGPELWQFFGAFGNWGRCRRGLIVDRKSVRSLNFCPSSAGGGNASGSAASGTSAGDADDSGVGSGCECAAGGLELVLAGAGVKV